MKPGSLIDSAAPRDLPRTIPRAARETAELVAERWSVLRASSGARAALADEDSIAGRERFERNIENFIGTVKVPVGLAGPLRVRGAHARGDYYLPLATTEAVLVASHTRGARLITEAGGCAAAVLADSITRAPGFAFVSLHDALTFASWIESQETRFQQITATTTRHGRLQGLRITIEANHV